MPSGYNTEGCTDVSCLLAGHEDGGLLARMTTSAFSAAVSALSTVWVGDMLYFHDFLRDVL